MDIEIKQKKLHGVWSAMKYRCNAPTCKWYANYGGRGITHCSEWANFNNFYEWAINNGYEVGLTLDRINNDGNYEPNNCRWITNAEQQNNRSFCYDVTINGETKTLKEWCKVYDIKYHTVISRIKTYGYETIEALTTPLKRTGGNGR